MNGDRFILMTEKSIEGDWSKKGIRRIIENLCSNAIKYGEPHRPITVSVLQESGLAAIEIHNEGRPIPAEDLPTLFDQYRRTESAERGGQRGWGLGLTLVRGIAEAHGGRVSVESSMARGTTFRVVFRIPR
jgi:signal transduction histidine kinase